VTAPLRLFTNASLTASTSTGVDLGYGLKASGSLSITGNLIPSIVANGQFAVTNIQVSQNTNLGINYAGAAPTVSSSAVAMTVNATFVSTGPLKVVIYNGTVFSLNCNNGGLSQSGLLLNCQSSSLMSVDLTAAVTAAINQQNLISSFTADPGTTQPPVVAPSPPRRRSIDEEQAMVFYYKDWAQVPLPVCPFPYLIALTY
jgi:hypothetical protein